MVKVSNRTYIEVVRAAMQRGIGFAPKYGEVEIVEALEDMSYIEFMIGKHTYKYVTDPVAGRYVKMIGVDNGFTFEGNV